VRGRIERPTKGVPGYAWVKNSVSAVAKAGKDVRLCVVYWNDPGTNYSNIRKEDPSWSNRVSRDTRCLGRAPYWYCVRQAPGKSPSSSASENEETERTSYRPGTVTGAHWMSLRTYLEEGYYSWRVIIVDVG